MQNMKIVLKSERYPACLISFQQIGMRNLKKSEYRNAVRSRRLFCDALLELLDEKPLDKIKITDITNRADICRGTFYLHYEDDMRRLPMKKELTGGRL